MSRLVDPQLGGTLKAVAHRFIYKRSSLFSPQVSNRQLNCEKNKGLHDRDQMHVLATEIF